MSGAEDLCRWLLTLDDPADRVGMAERQTVTLTKIIGRARAALAAQPSTPPAEPLHEWACPSCGAVTRARMADALPAEPPAEVRTEPAQLPAHPRIWWDGRDFLYLLPGPLLGEPDEDGQVRDRRPGFYRSQTVEDVTASEGPVIELTAYLESAEVRTEPATVAEIEESILDANERMGEALTAIGMALGLPRPRTGATWGAPEILARIAAQEVRTEWAVRYPDEPPPADGDLDRGSRDAAEREIRQIARRYGVVGTLESREVRSWVGPWSPAVPPEATDG